MPRRAIAIRWSHGHRFKTRAHRPIQEPARVPRGLLLRRLRPLVGRPSGCKRGARRTAAWSRKGAYRRRELAECRDSSQAGPWRSLPVMGGCDRARRPAHSLIGTIAMSPKRSPAPRRREHECDREGDAGRTLAPGREGAPARQGERAPLDGSVPEQCIGSEVRRTDQTRVLSAALTGTGRPRGRKPRRDVRAGCETFRSRLS